MKNLVNQGFGEYDPRCAVASGRMLALILTESRQDNTKTRLLSIPSCSFNTESQNLGAAKKRELNLISPDNMLKLAHEYLGRKHMHPHI